MFSNKIFLASLFVFLSVVACQYTSVQVNDTPKPIKDTPTPEKGSRTPMETYLGLRDIWFTTKPEELGISVDDNSRVPYAVVMEWGYDEFTATIASSIVGDGSLITSSGPAVLGGVGYVNIREASIHFVEVAASFVDKMELTTEFPLPSAGYIRFYLITPNGIYTADEVSFDVFDSGNHELLPLLDAGNDVITEIRKTIGQ